MFCFCCKLSKSANNRSLLANAGLCDWQHLSERLKKHEISAEHITNMNTWNELNERFDKNQTIDKNLQEKNYKRKNAYETSFFRIFCAVKCLASYNLAFRGSNDKLYQDGNGNFWVWLK